MGSGRGFDKMCTGWLWNAVGNMQRVAADTCVNRSGVREGVLGGRYISSVSSAYK